MIAWPLLAVILGAPFSWSEELVLVEPSGKPSAQYQTLVGNVRPGDEVYFRGTRFRFQVLKILGNGNSSRVFLVVPVWPTSLGGRAMALRVPFLAGSSTHRDWIAGMKTLRRQGVRVPKVFRATDDFALVEAIAVDLTATQLFYPPVDKDPELIKRAEKAFYEFVHSTKNFARIADFRPVQLVYSDQTREWVLLDATKPHEFKPWRSFADEGPGRFNPFVGFFEKMVASEMRPDPSAIWKAVMDQRKLAIAKEVERIHLAYPFRQPIGFIECLRSVVE